MKPFNRRKFLKVASFSIGGVCLSTIPLLGKSGTIKSLKSHSNIDIIALKKRAATAFHKKDFQTARSIYTNLIATVPQDITNYDGLAKLYHIEHNYTSVINLYKEGLDINKENPLFQDRLARAYSKLATANEKQAQQYSIQGADLFSLSIKLYLSAIAAVPNLKYLRFGLLDILSALKNKNKKLTLKGKQEIEIPSDLQKEIEEKIIAYKSEWTKRKYPTKRNNFALSEKEIKESLIRLDNKERRTLYFDEEYQIRHKEIASARKKYLVQLFHKAINKKGIEAAIDLYKQIKNLDNKETYCKGVLVKYLYKERLYDSLIALYEYEIENMSYGNKEEAFWQKASLARAIYLKGLSHNNSADITKALFLYKKLEETKPYSGKSFGALYHGLGTIQMKLNQYTEARKDILKGVEVLIHGSIADSLYIKYAETYLKENNQQQAEQLLLAMTDGQQIQLKGRSMSTSNPDPILEYIAKAKKEQQWLRENGVKKNRVQQAKQPTKLRSLSKNTNDSAQNVEYLYALAKLYEKTNNTEGIQKVLVDIQSINPNNKFLQKRSK